MEQDDICSRLKKVRGHLREACSRSGRKEEEVCLIAVSKTKPLPDLWAAYEAGVRDFGENKVQELVDKMDELPKDIRWHLIGHLQRNKVKYVVGRTALIHSVDSLRLAEEINREAEKKNAEVAILIEVNVAGEESKYGVSVSDCPLLVEQIAQLSHVHIKGLMTIAPYVECAEDNRKYFSELKKLAVDIAAKNIDNVSMEHLSMGMTGDYEVAIEEGATLVRVGTGIFGARDYTGTV